MDKIVIFTGGLPHEQLIPYYDMCDLFVLPSRRGINESFGSMFVEATARSKPCIGVNEGGMVDIIIDGKTGFLVPSGDVKALQDKITYLMFNRERLRQLGKNARLKAEETYRSNTVALQFERNLRKAVQLRQESP